MYGGAYGTYYAEPPPRVPFAIDPPDTQTTRSSRTRKIIHADCDSFFASVEMRDDPSLRDLPVVPMAEVRTPWYLRMEAEDKPGVLSAVASIFSEQGISIEGLIQKAPEEGETRVPLIVLTNDAAQGCVDNAVRAIEALDNIAGDIARIRVESLDG